MTRGSDHWLQLILERIEGLERLLSGKECELTTVARAIKRMPMRNSAARKFLYERGLVPNVEGRSPVIWPDVIEQIRSGTGMAIVRDKYHTNSVIVKNKSRVRIAESELRGKRETS